MRIPLYIDFSNKKVLIIGGGFVGTSRAKKFLEYGAKVFVLSKEFSEELLDLSRDGKISLIKDDALNLDLLEKIIPDYDLVVVAIADTSINEFIKKISRKYRVLVNLANDAKETEVVVPFEGGYKGIRFAVTTEGKSGVVARKVRDSFQKLLEEDEQTIFFLNAMDHLKKYMKANNVPVNLRMRLYFIISSNEEFRRLIREEKVDEARVFAEKLVKEYVSGKRKIEDEIEF
ncbi:MAG: bifunctional precorrin-2 dehydrogenase/sirohydrochlorin ferrochelatase [Archaeoglobaceae archaeon]|nr:bifunctional precorrin-2 dehydrogenase/sirohydrochlorin ferrochelatase [Archaeoglobaceae archaeon]